MATFVTITHNDNEALTFGHVDFPGYGQDGGVLYLGIVGVENIVNAMVAHLLADDNRGTNYGSEIRISGAEYPKPLYLRRYVKYHLVRSRLSEAHISVALIHPEATVESDSVDEGFYIINHDTERTEIPADFFPRLNRTLQIPLRAEWADFLFEEGQKPQGMGGYASDVIPITPMESSGPVLCYRVRTGRNYAAAWLKIIRDKLGLWVDMHCKSHDLWEGGPYTLTKQNGTWQLLRNNKLILEHDGLAQNAIKKANDDYGTALRIGE